MEYFLLLLGLAVLIGGGELLVRGAVALALKFNISVLVVGMTVVSFGTSAPELLVSVKAALEGHPDISMGNVVGSNIANISLILGLTTLIFPILVNKDSIRFDWPIMMASGILMFLFAINRVIGPLEGAVLFLLLVFINVWMIYKSRKANKKAAAEEEELKFSVESTVPLWRSLLFIILGCAGLVFGAEWFLDGAVAIAGAFGVDERVIAITIVAFGTSVPELITSVVAAFKKETDISIGNLIGSNIFNVLGILGITSMVKEIKVSEAIINIDIPWMLAVFLALFPLMYFGKRIGRLKGAALFLFYFVYIFMVLM